MSAWIRPFSLISISLWYLVGAVAASEERVEQRTSLPPERIAQNSDLSSYPLQNEKKPSEKSANEEVLLVTERSAFPATSNFRVWENFGKKNHAVQIQKGEFLTSWIRQEPGSRANLALTIQIGTNLFAAILQAGELHRAYLLQRGDHLSAILVQKNIGNKAHVIQMGAHLSATVLQNADHATVFVSQMGAGNSVAVTQR